MRDDFMNYGSLFSGIGGFDIALERAGFTCAWQSEIDKDASKILERHWPGKNLGDIKNIGHAEPVDLICGGFPCQDLSVAGKRAGLAGERSGLWFEFARIIDGLEPQWVVVENVPGLLSSNRGQDFAVIIQWLAKRGYGVAWRVLDAQYFGLAQRRRRVFIVGSLGNGRAAEVLFERESVSGDIEAGRRAGKEIAGTLTFGPHPGGADGKSINGNLLLAAPLVARQAKGAFTDPVNDNIISFTMRGGGGQGGKSYLESVDQAMTLGGQDQWIHNSQVGVRRLTPTECERLQGYPDGWTAGQADSARYRQLGNAVAVPVVEWIMKRIAALA